MRRELKKSVVYGLYAISFALLLSGVILLGYSFTSKENETYQYVSKGILDYEEDVKVVKSETIISRPYDDVNISIVKKFYDYKGDSATQEEALIYYEGTYIPSSGVSYSKGTEFDVSSILPGTVTDITQDEILGNTITIEHDNGIISVYQSIKDISVSEGEVVAQGQIIAKSGESNISKDLGNHLYFELIINGECVNPEDYYNKQISEI